MKTLFVSDLDGTLLDKTPKTSEYTNSVLNALNEAGMTITFATARSFVTTKKVTKGLKLFHPLVVHNGTFIVDKDGAILVKNVFEKSDAHDILSDILQNDLSPVVFSLIDEKQKFSYVKESLNDATNDFINERQKDERNHPVKTADELYSGEIYYFTLIGDEAKTKKLYEKFKHKYKCYFQRDIYSNEYWLEITPKHATKANAVRQLAKLLECDKIVAFGDGINDLEMFTIANEAYAVENAVEQLKEKATKIIESNVKNGVAKWLKKRYTKD